MLALFFSAAFAQSWNNTITLSSNITTETIDITDFNALDVSEDFEVIVRMGEGPETIQIEANENLHELIDVRKVGSTLTISTKSYSTNNEGANEQLKAYITVKELQKIKGSEDVVFILEDPIKTDDFRIELDEDSVLKGHLDVKHLVVYLDEDAEVDIDGTAEIMEIDTNEDSILKGYDFVVDDLKIKMNEGSEVKLTVHGAIDLRAKEDCTFSYKGNAEFTRKKLGEDSEVKSW